MRIPRLFHDWHTAVGYAHQSARRTGLRQIVRREVTPAWPFGIWRVREAELQDA